MKQVFLKKEAALMEILKAITQEKKSDIPEQLTDWTGCPTRTLKKARRFLNDLRQKAWELRLTYLATQEELAALKNEKK